MGIFVKSFFLSTYCYGCTTAGHNKESKEEMNDGDGENRFKIT